MSSLRIAPPASHPTSTSNTTRSTSSTGAPSAPGLHDTLRTNLSLNTTPSSPKPSQQQQQQQQLQSSHPLESRLRNWQATQDALKMNLLRREFGMAEPVRRGMELKICREGEYRPRCLGGSARVGEDILRGRDAEVAWEDVYGEQMETEMETGGGGEVQAEIDGRVGLGEW